MKAATVDGQKLKLARELAGLTQEQVAIKVGVDRSAISLWESSNARKQPTGANYRRLCTVLGVKPHDLLNKQNVKAAS